MPAQAKGESFIAGGVRIKGELDCPGEIRIDGSVEGDIKTSRLTVGETAIIKGNVVAETALVEGNVTGQIKAKSVVLARTAKVTGDVFHTTLTIEPGAAVDGRYRPLEAVTPAAAAAGAFSEPAKAPIDAAAALRQSPGLAETKIEIEPAGPPVPPDRSEPVRFSLTGGKVTAVAAASLAVLALIGLVKPELWDRPELAAAPLAAEAKALPEVTRESADLAEARAVPSPAAPESRETMAAPVAPAIAETATPPEPKPPAPSRPKAASDRSKTEGGSPVARPRPAAQKSAAGAAQGTRDPSRWGEGVEIKARNERPAEAALPRETEGSGSFQPPVSPTRHGTN